MRENKMNNKKTKRSYNQSYINNCYAVTSLAKTCKKRLIFIIINAIMTYFEWLFAEVFLIKKIVEPTFFSNTYVIWNKNHEPKDIVKDFIHLFT